MLLLSPYTLGCLLGVVTIAAVACVLRNLIGLLARQYQAVTSQNTPLPALALVLVWKLAGDVQPGEHRSPVSLGDRVWPRLRLQRIPWWISSHYDGFFCHIAHTRTFGTFPKTGLC